MIEEVKLSESIKRSEPKEKLPPIAPKWPPKPAKKESKRGPVAQQEFKFAAAEPTGPRIEHRKPLRVRASSESKGNMMVADSQQALGRAL